MYYKGTKMYYKGTKMYYKGTYVQTQVKGFLGTPEHYAVHSTVQVGTWLIGISIGNI